MFRLLIKVITITASLFMPLIGHSTTIAQDPLYLVVSAHPNVLFNMSIETPMGGAGHKGEITR
jgi:type IV pilus assembly protein PilY1